MCKQFYDNVNTLSSEMISISENWSLHKLALAFWYKKSNKFSVNKTHFHRNI